MAGSWTPKWLRHEHLLPHLRARIEAHPGRPLPFRFHDGREVPWFKSPNGSDEGLLRFLQARDGDVEQAAIMFVRHLEWRRYAFPIHREGVIAEILDEALPHQKRRFAKMGINHEGLLVIKVDWLYGRFVTERYKALDCVKAFLLWIEENIITAPASLERQVVVLSYGGFCPADYGRAFVALMMDNYPERLVRMCIWPVNDWVVRIVRAFVLMFIPQSVNEKIFIERDESKMLAILGLHQSQLPTYMQGGADAIFTRDFESEEIDASRMRRMVLDGFRSRGRNETLQNWPWATAPSEARARVENDYTKESAVSASSCLCGCFGRPEDSSEHNAPLRPGALGTVAGPAVATQPQPKHSHVAFALIWPPYLWAIIVAASMLAVLWMRVV